jgi:hypothetical protein
MKQEYLNKLYAKLYNFKSAKKKIGFSEKDVSHQDLVDILMTPNLQDSRARNDRELRYQNSHRDAEKLQKITAEFLPFIREEMICLVRDSYKGDPREFKHIEREHFLNMIFWKSSSCILRTFELFGDDFSDRADNRDDFYQMIKRSLVIKITTKNQAFIKKIDVMVNKIFDLVVERLNKYNNNDLNTEVLEKEALMFIVKISKSFPSLKDKVLNLILPYLNHEKKSFHDIVFIGFKKLAKNFPDEIMSLVQSYKTHENTEIAKTASQTLTKIKRKILEREIEEEEDEDTGYEEDYHEDFDYEDDDVRSVLMV